MKVGEFFVDLGITSSGASTLKDFIGAMGNMRLSTLGTLGALGAVGAYIGGVVDNASGAAVAFQKFSNQTGLSAQELQKWQIVAKQANVSATDVAASVTNLQNNLAGIRLGQGNIAPFQIMGVSPLGNAFQVLSQLRAARGRFSPEQFTRQISAMGLSPSMVNVLALSDKEFQNFIATAQGMSSQVQDSVLQMTEAFNQLYLKLKDINYEIAGIVSAPVVEGLKSILGELSRRQSVPQRLGQAAAAIFDVAFGTKLAAGLRGINEGWNRRQETQRLYQIRVAVEGKSAPTYEEFAKQLEDSLNAAEAQIPVPESRGAR